jgi:hypothetical protein
MFAEPGEHEYEKKENIYGQNRRHALGYMVKAK